MSEKTQKIWPRDSIGNEIREGKLIRLELPESAALFHVAHVSAASFLHGEDGPIPINGDIELICRFKFDFSPQNAALVKALCIQQPEAQDSPTRQ